MNKKIAIQNIINYIYDVERKNFQEEYSMEKNNWLNNDDDIFKFIKENKKEINHIFVSLYYLNKQIKRKLVK